METCFEQPCCSARGEVPPEVIEAVRRQPGDAAPESEPSIADSVSPFDCLDSPSQSSRPRGSTWETVGPASSPGASMAVAKTLTKEERLVSGGYSDVDDEILWGIPLRRSLKRLGRVWRYKPATWKPAQRAELHELSQNVESFDVFLSHTWQTPGWHKAVALSFQCGWRSTFALWCVAELASTAFQPEMGFIDVVSINQEERTFLVLLFSVLPLGVYVVGRSGDEYRFTIYLAFGTFYVLNGVATALLRRIFIHSAISKWYGSKAKLKGDEAFTEFVRQDLRQDLEPGMAKRFPFKYLLLLMAALVSVSMEFFVAMWKGGAPFESLLAFALAILLGVDVFVGICLSVILNYLSDRFAARRFGRLDHVQTFLILGCSSGELQLQAVSLTLSPALNIQSFNSPRIISLVAAMFYYSNNLAVAAYASSLEHCILFAALSVLNLLWFRLAGTGYWYKGAVEAVVSGALAGCLCWLDRHTPMPDISEHGGEKIAGELPQYKGASAISSRRNAEEMKNSSCRGLEGLLLIGPFRLAWILSSGVGARVEPKDTEALEDLEDLEMEGDFAPTTRHNHKASRSQDVEVPGHRNAGRKEAVREAGPFRLLFEISMANPAPIAVRRHPEHWFYDLDATLMGPTAVYPGDASISSTLALMYCFVKNLGDSLRLKDWNNASAQMLSAGPEDEPFSQMQVSEASAAFDGAGQGQRGRALLWSLLWGLSTLSSPPEDRSHKIVGIVWTARLPEPGVLEALRHELTELVEVFRLLGTVASRIRRMWYWSELWKTPQWLALPWQKHQRCKAYKPAITVRALACLREERRSGSESDGFGASRPHFVPEELLQIFARSWALASPRALEALSATEAAPGVFRLRALAAEAFCRHARDAPLAALGGVLESLVAERKRAPAPGDAFHAPSGQF
ncbi:hypothetical protein AK812_SmicGene23129 [Symbiodinium microadriaticum]|uniref:Uncharacterized protein n=1 Tax=Symbiodinium microadriaticum TaxID=2951 RepID=A0A1Q9DI13_SYMMI|nr:hypothetical protein AK812_SmicGene23129 [Symbiodinium microadriaticum]